MSVRPSRQADDRNIAETTAAASKIPIRVALEETDMLSRVKDAPENAKKGMAEERRITWFLLNLSLNLFSPSFFSFLSALPTHLPTYSIKFCLMGFCRRCGEIVSGPKCRCGGTAVGEHFSPARVMDHPG